MDPGYISPFAAIGTVLVVLLYYWLVIRKQHEAEKRKQEEQKKLPEFIKEENHETHPPA